MSPSRPALGLIQGEDVASEKKPFQVAKARQEHKLDFPLFADTDKEAAKERNRGFLYLKPSANTEKARESLLSMLRHYKITVEREGEVDTDTIIKSSIVERHYGSIAKRAFMDPKALVLQPKAKSDFQAAFGLHWDEALSQGRVYNAPDALEQLGLTAQQLDDIWSPLELGVNKIKFGGGFYCGLIAGMFIINGFYMAMRATYTQPGQSVRWFNISWNSSRLAWATFRREVLGATNPLDATPESIRGSMLRRWRSLELPGKPHLGENCVHASASPFEALVERCNWTGSEMTQEKFAMQAMATGVTREELLHWSTDPLVNFDGRRQSLFDLVEDLDCDACLSKLREVAKQNHDCDTLAENSS